MFCLELDVQPEIKTWKLSIQWLQAGNFISQQEFGVCCVKPYLQYLLHNPLIICLIKEHLQSSYEWMRPFSYEDCCHLSNLKTIVTPIKEFPFGLAGYLVRIPWDGTRIFLLKLDQASQLLNGTRIKIFCSSFTIVRSTYFSYLSNSYCKWHRAFSFNLTALSRIKWISH